MRQIVALVVACLAVADCSSSDSSGAPGCDPAKCGPGNVCVANSCKKVCTSQAGCPTGSYCNDEQPRNWCATNTFPSPLPSAPKGEFNDPCRALADCDVDHHFACYATGTTDAAAFCTLFNCAEDSDCPGGWWCATVNQAPNIATDKRSFGETLTWCLPRDYCAPCKADHDCQSQLGSTGTKQHCAADTSGAGFCSPQCASNTNCPPDAQCATRWTVCEQTKCTTAADCRSLGGVAETCDGGECRVACTADADCPPSNQAPQHCNAGLCVPASCASDDDCPPTAGTFQHCNAGRCTPECSSAADCAPDQTCQSLSLCFPRAGVCVGKSSFCSPCRSDDDCACASSAGTGTGGSVACARGYCVEAAPYSTERFCSQPLAAGATCSAMGVPSPGGCPQPPPGAKASGLVCSNGSGAIGGSQCLGTVVFGKSAGAAQAVPGCWTPDR